MMWNFEFDECATDKKPTEVENKDWNGASYGLRKDRFNSIIHSTH